MEDDEKGLGKRATEATVKFVVVLAVMIFAAGSLSYWQGWLFLLHFSAWITATTAYFLKYDRALLEQRLHVGPAAEQEPAQKRIQFYNSVVLIALFVGSALDHRFGWSVVPVPVVLFGNFLVAAGFYGCFLVLRQNSFASATVEIRGDQRVISSGLYGVVRHPMYAAALVLFLGVPLALGSYWGLFAIPFAIVGLAARLLDEERHLVRDLPGYDDYRCKVRYRLVPGIW